MSTYQGHLPDGEGVQKHSAGDIYPVIIIHYGDGSARWVDQRRGLASPKQMQTLAAATIHEAAQAYMEVRHAPLPPGFRKLLARFYQEFLQEFVR
jgi:hypothetical protein